MPNASRSAPLRRLLFAAAVGLPLAGCNSSGEIPKHMRAVPSALQAKMVQMEMAETSPIFIRVFKEESALEVWKQTSQGSFDLLKVYAICKWSGELGPKIVEGDRQAPEGFYTVTPAQMNPNSSYYLSFNIGYPNAFDRALGRTGSNLMIHGACSSAGCYSMDDEPAGEIFALARDAFRGGQRAFQVHAFPFRMTAENMARHRDNKHFAFWQMLKVGYDHFEVMRQVPKVDVCERRYVFDAEAGSASFNPSGACPAYAVPETIRAAVAQRQANDEVLFQRALARLKAPPAEATPVAAAVRATPAAAAAPAPARPAPPAAAPTAAAPPPVVQAAAVEPKRTWKDRMLFWRSKPETVPLQAPSAPASAGPLHTGSTALAVEPGPAATPTPSPRPSPPEAKPAARASTPAAPKPPARSAVGAPTAAVPLAGPSPVAPRATAVAPAPAAVAPVASPADILSRPAPAPVGFGDRFGGGNG